MPLVIDARNLHPCTALSLEALARLQERREFSTILDMGCGNGILGITAARLWDAAVLAVDISPHAVEDTRRNAEQQGVSGQLTARRADLFNDEEIHRRGPYDLIIFNLLAEPIVAMAPEVKAHLAPGGMAIIGGILAWKAAETAQAYAGLGFEILEEIVESPWHTYLLSQQDNLTVTKA